MDQRIAFVQPYYEKETLHPLPPPKSYVTVTHLKYEVELHDLRLARKQSLFVEKLCKNAADAPHIYCSGVFLQYISTAVVTFDEHYIN